MADNKIDKLIELISNETKINDVKIEVGKAHLDFISKLISVVIAAIGIILGVIGITGVNKLPDERTYIYYVLTFSATIFVLVFYILYRKQTNKIIEYQAKNFGHLKTVLETFSSLEESYKSKTENLDKQLGIAKETAKNIANSPLSNLISWQQSGEMEIESDRVFAISIDLEWINNEKKLNEIFNDLKEKKGDKYFYILTSNSEKALKNYNDVIGFLTEQANLFPNDKLDERFQVVKLIDYKVGGCKVYEDGNFTLPIPNDIVIYKKERKKVVVISTATVTRDRDNSDEINKYDVKFTDDHQVARVELWFKRIWKEITSTSIDNE